MKNGFKILTRLILGVLLLAFIFAAPARLIEQLDNDIYLEWLKNEEPEWQGILRIWNIYDDEMRIDTELLRKVFKSYEKANPGVYIELAGLKEDEARIRLEKGETPDVWVFPERIRPAEANSDVKFSLPLPKEEKKIEAEFEFDVSESGEEISKDEAHSSAERMACAAWIRSRYSDYSDRAFLICQYLAEEAESMVE